MDESDKLRIYVKPKRGRLPWRYEIIDKPKRGDRWIFLTIGLLILFWGVVIWRVVR